MADYISVRLPTDLAPKVERHQRRVREQVGAEISFTAAVVALLNIGDEAAEPVIASKPQAQGAA